MKNLLLVFFAFSLCGCSIFLSPKKNISRLIKKHEYLPKKDTIVKDTVLIDTLRVDRIDTLNNIDSIIFYSDSISYKIYREFDTIKTFIQCTPDTIFLEKKIKITDSEKIISQVKKDNEGYFQKLLKNYWFYISTLVLFLIFALLLKIKR
jgi:hypothetical protein